MSGAYNIVVEQGATFRKELTWKDNSGNPIDLTGYTAKMQIRKKHGAADPAAATLSDADGSITLGGASGTIILNMTSTITAALTLASGFYDLELTSGGGFVTRLLEGTYVLRPEITKV